MTHDSRTDDEYTIVYTIKARQVAIPQSLNEHCNKNPFKQETARRKSDYHATHRGVETAQAVLQGGEAEFIVRCLSGFKTALKCKQWHIDQVPKPGQNEHDSSVMSSRSHDDSKSRVLEHRPSESSVKSHEEYKWDPGLSSFVDEVQALRANIEYTHKATPAICASFKVMHCLPLVTLEEVRAKQIQLPRPTPKQSDKTLLIELDHLLLASSLTKPAGLSAASRPAKKSQGWHKIYYSSVAHGGEQAEYVRLRPHARRFLAQLKDIYEIIVFTSAEANYATRVVQALLDPHQKYIQDILAQDHCLRKGEYYLKDVRVIGNRDPAKMLVLDSSIIPFSSNLDNGLAVPPYHGEDRDEALLPLIDFLKTAASEPDIRLPLRKTYLLSDLYRVYLKEHASDSPPKSPSRDVSSDGFRDILGRSIGTNSTPDAEA
jgi:Dullard-like phosphatase family protein